MKNQHNKSLSILAIPALLLLPFMGISQASAHGYSTYPEARQLTCANEGGYFSGTPPMQGCSTAKDISSTYPFVQINEFSINIADYLNQATVEAAIPDGTLCHANDPRKVGMSAVNNPDAWTRTELNAGTFTYTFNATAPHNPSFWKFYITKQGTDLNQPLKWSDLELIKEDNDSVVGSMYSTDLTIPDDRIGDHILFVRWQRIDFVGEGFYNCSDITVLNDEVTEPEPVEPYLVQGEEYVLPEYEIGDRIIFEVITQNGDVHNTFNKDVTQTNYEYIPELVAAEVSGYYASFYNGDVFIGRWHQEMNHYMYFDNGSTTNYFNARNANFTYTVRVEQAVAEPITLGLKELSESDRIIEHGEYASLVIEGSYNNFVVEELSGVGVEISSGMKSILIGTDTIPKAILPVDVILKVTTNPDDASEQEQSISFTVVDNEDTSTVPPGSQWDASATYIAGDVVSYDNQLWQAQWWILGGMNPVDTYASDIWGVWRPVTE